MIVWDNCAKLTLLAYVLAQPAQAGDCYTIIDAQGQTIYKAEKPPFDMSYPPFSEEYEASRARGERLLNSGEHCIFKKPAAKQAAQPAAIEAAKPAGANAAQPPAPAPQPAPASQAGAQRDSTALARSTTPSGTDTAPARPAPSSEVSSNGRKDAAVGASAAEGGAQPAAQGDNQKSSGSVYKCLKDSVPGYSADPPAANGECQALEIPGASRKFEFFNPERRFAGVAKESRSYGNSPSVAHYAPSSLPVQSVATPTDDRRGSSSFGDPYAQDASYHLSLPANYWQPLPSSAYKCLKNGKILYGLDAPDTGGQCQTVTLRDDRPSPAELARVLEENRIRERDRAIEKAREQAREAAEMERKRKMAEEYAREAERMARLFASPPHSSEQSIPYGYQRFASPSSESSSSSSSFSSGTGSPSAPSPPSASPPSAWHPMPPAPAPPPSSSGGERHFSSH